MILTFKFSSFFSQNKSTPGSVKIAWLDGSIFNAKETNIVKYTYTKPFLLRSQYITTLKKDSIEIDGKKYPNTSDYNKYLKFGLIEPSSGFKKNIDSLSEQDTLKWHRVIFSKNGSFCLVSKLKSRKNEYNQKQVQFELSVYNKGHLVSTINTEYNGVFQNEYSINDSGIVLLATYQSQIMVLKTRQNQTIHNGNSRKLIMIHPGGEIINQQELAIDSTYRFGTMHNTTGLGFILNLYSDRNRNIDNHLSNIYEEIETFNYKLIYIDKTGNVRWNKNITLKGYGSFGPDFSEKNNHIFFRISLSAYFQEPKIIYDQQEVKCPFIQDSHIPFQAVLMHIDSTGKLVWFSQQITDSVITDSNCMVNYADTNRIYLLSVQCPFHALNEILHGNLSKTSIVLTTIDLTSHQTSTQVILENCGVRSIQDCQLLSENEFLVTADFSQPPPSQSIIAQEKVAPGQIVKMTGIFTVDTR